MFIVKKIIKIARFSDTAYLVNGNSLFTQYIFLSFIHFVSYRHTIVFNILWFLLRAICFLDYFPLFKIFFLL